ncbi:hypothetical protein KCU85_g40, partial [Aureobasidium melanogenum]
MQSENLTTTLQPTEQPGKITLLQTAKECTLGPAFASARLCNHTFSSSLIWGWLQLPGWEHERKVYVCARHPCRHVRGLQVLLLLGPLSPSSTILTLVVSLWQTS